MLIMKNTTIYIFILLFLSTLNAFAAINRDVFETQHLSTSHGLSSQRVFSIVEDKFGAIWISTKDGVDRYNGNIIKNYKLTGQFYHGDMAGRILRLFYSEKDGLWVYDQTGKIFKYSEKNDAFILILALDHLIQEPVTLNKFYIDNQGNYWFGTQSGAYKIDHNNELICVLSNKYVTDIISINNCNIIATSQGVYLLSSDYMNGIQVLNPDMYVQTLYHDDEKNELWIGTFNEGLRAFNMNDKSWISIKQNEENLNPIRSITSYDDQTLLVGIDGGGVYSVNKDNYKSSLLMGIADNIRHTRLQGNGVYTVIKDTQGNIWVGSYTGGVSVAILLHTPTTILVHETGNANSLIDNNINGVEENIDGSIWFSTDSGISICSMKTGKWMHLLKGIVITGLCKGEKGTMWASTYGNGVYHLNKHGEIIAHMSTKTKDLTTNYILSIHFEDDGSLWVGGLGGKLVLINEKKKRKQLYDIDWVQSIQSVNNDTLAVATVQGFYLINKLNDSISHHATSIHYRDMNASSYIISMLFNDDNTVWLGTEGGGLCLYDFLNGQVKTILTVQDGLPSNDIYSVQYDCKNRIWVSTGKGLAMVNNFHVSKFNYLGGVDKAFNKSSFCKLSNDYVVYGSTSGAVLLNTDTLGSNEYKAPIRFTDLIVKNLSAEQIDNIYPNLYDMLIDGDVKLKYDYNSFSVNYESINYCYRRDIVYQHILEGYDRSWSEPTSQGIAQYTNVTPGSYKLKIRSLRHSDGKIVSECNLLINIAQPWWNSYYAWVIYFLLLIGVFYFILRYKNNQMQKKYDEEKLEYFINTAHDIRTPVTLVMAPLEDLSKDASLSPNAIRLLELAQNNTHKLYSLITRLLEFEKIESYQEQLKLTPQCLNEILSREVISFKPYCEQKQQNLELRLPNESIYINADSYMLEMLLDNLISNACKYTPQNGDIVIRLLANKKTVIIEVEDNGIGIPNNARRYLLKNVYRASNATSSESMGNGFGLLQVQRIVAALHGKISYQSEEGKGTTFKVVLNRIYKTIDIETLSEDIRDKKYESNSRVINTIEQRTEDSYAVDCEDRETLLIVEDNDSLRNYLCNIFEKDYRVIDKPDGQAALNYLSEEYPDLILSDVMMPGIQGDELCHRIKLNPDTEGIPFILLTAKVNHDAVVVGLKNGADDYIPKPFSTEILKLKVQGLLENRKRLRNYLMRQSLQQVQNAKQKTMTTGLLEGFAASVHAPKESCNEKQAKVEISQYDCLFVKQVTQIIIDNIDNNDFTINILCQNMAMSRTLFFSRLKSLTGKAPQDFIRMIRLQKAVELLKEGMTVSEVACETGFVNTKYFSTLFKKEFGVQPSKYIQK